MKLPEQLSRNILTFRDLMLKIHVNLVDMEGENKHNEFMFNSIKYLKFNPYVYLTLTYMKQNEQYSPDKRIKIGQGNIAQYVNKTKRLLNSIYTQKIFAMDGDKIITYGDMVKKYTERITVPMMNSTIVLQPSVVYDENDISYEGVTIYINRLENAAQLSIEDYEALVYTLSKIDLFTYSQSLINYMILTSRDATYRDIVVKNNARYDQAHVNDNIQEESKSNYARFRKEDVFKGLRS